MSNSNRNNKNAKSPEKALYEAFSRAANSIIALHRQGVDSSIDGYNEGYATFLIQFLTYVREMDRRMIRSLHSGLTSPYINGDLLLKYLYGICNLSRNHSKINRHLAGNMPLSQPHSSASIDLPNRELKRRLMLLKTDEEDNPFEREIFKKFRRQRRDPDSEGEDML